MDFHGQATRQNLSIVSSTLNTNATKNTLSLFTYITIYAIRSRPNVGISSLRPQPKLAFFFRSSRPKLRISRLCGPKQGFLDRRHQRNFNRDRRDQKMSTATGRTEGKLTATGQTDGKLTATGATEGKLNAIGGTEGTLTATGRTERKLIATGATKE